MKLNIQRRIIPFVCAFVLLISTISGVSAVVIEPYDYKTEIVPDDNGNYIVTLDMPKDDIFWAWGDTPSDWVTHHTEIGASSSYDTTENYLDNWWLYILTFGYDEARRNSNMMATANLTTDATLNIDFQLVMSCHTSQNFKLKTTVKIAYCDSTGSVNVIENIYVEDFEYVADYDDEMFLDAKTFYAIDKSKGDYFFLYITVDPSDLADESITSPVSVNIVDDNNQIVMPLKSLYVQSQENAQLDKTMQKVEQQIADNGQKLDDLISGSAEDQEKGEQFEEDMGNKGDDIQDDSDRLDELTPTAPTINSDLGLNVEYLSGVSSVLNLFWSLVGFQNSMNVVVLVATVAYIFFGKRDA